MNFTYFSHRECPICGGARKDCRQNTQNGLIHCRDGSATPVGFHLIGEDALGFFMWAEGDGKDGISQEERERRELDRRIKRQRREEEKRRGALPIPERDAAIRKLHAHFGLGKNHRADLKRRGLSDEQIDRLRFFTIQPGDRVPSGVPENLPGIRYGKIAGSQGFAYTEGFACPTFTPERQASGYQIRLDGTVEGGKYRWAKGAVSSHLPNGELPITYVRPLDGQIKRNAIGMCEGILKPAIASQKLGQIFIGASGFQFSKDGIVDGENTRVPLEQLLDYLEAASTELGGIKEVEIYPDAGVVRNPQIYQKYKWLIDELTKLGYKVKIVWWGQWSKEHPDCDELPEGIELKLITPGQFADFAKRLGGADNAYMQKVRREWKKNKKFTPDIVEKTKWVTWGRPADNTMFFGRSRLGSGKTTRLKTWVREWKDEGQRRFYVLGYRNTLLLQTASQLGFMHIHDGDAILLKRDEDTSFCLCVDSLMKIEPEDFEGSIVLLDEVQSVIRHLLHSPTIPSHKRDKILKLFENAIKSARVVICMDGLMSDWSVDYLAAIAPDKRTLKIQNSYKGKKPVINLLLGTLGLDEKQIKTNDRTPLIGEILKCPLPVICSDSRIFGESLEEIILEHYPEAKILRIDSKTVCEENVKEFFKDCDKYIKDNEVDVLIYSPSAESGLDVSIEGHFTHQFCFFFGVVTVDPIIQMIGRIRDPGVERFVWVKEWVAADEQCHTKSPFVVELEKEIGWIIQKESEEAAKRQFGDDEDSTKRTLEKIAKVTERSKDIHCRTSCVITGFENAERANLRPLCLQTLLQEGYGVNEIILQPDLDHKDTEKDAKEAVKRQDSSDIFNAPVPDEEIEELATQVLAFDAKWEDRCKRLKANLLHRNPGIQDSEVWSPDFVYLTRYKEPKFFPRQELFWLYKHIQTAEDEAARRLHWLARTDKTFIGKVRSDFLKVLKLHELGFERFLDLDATWHNDSPEILDLLQRSKEEETAKILGRPGKILGIQNLQRLGNPLGIFFRVCERSREDGKITRFYKLDSEQFFNPARLAVQEAIGKRYELAKEKKEKLDWNDVLHPEVTSNESGTGNHFEEAETTISRDTPPSNVYKKYRGGCHTPAGKSRDNSESEQLLCYHTEKSLGKSDSEPEQVICDNTEKSTENKSPEKSVAEQARFSEAEIQWMASSYIPLMMQDFEGEDFQNEVGKMIATMKRADMEQIASACDKAIWGTFREKAGIFAVLLPTGLSLAAVESKSERKARVIRPFIPQKEKLDWNDVLRPETLSNESATGSNLEVAEMTFSRDTPPSNVLNKYRGGCHTPAGKNSEPEQILCYHTEKSTENKSVADTTPVQKRFICIPSGMRKKIASENNLGSHAGNINTIYPTVTTGEVTTSEQSPEESKVTSIRIGGRLLIVPQGLSQTQAAALASRCKIGAVAAVELPPQSETTAVISQPIEHPDRLNVLPAERCQDAADVVAIADQSCGENLRPSLEDYRVDQEVWFYHPFTEKKWIKGVVISVTPGIKPLLRVQGTGAFRFFGHMIERPELIAPGDWVLEGG